MSLTLRQIEMFRAVMTAKSFVGAARILRVAQPTVTNVIARIEDKLGLPLFQRQGGRIYPTAEAAAILAEIDRAFVQLEQAVGRVDRVARRETAMLRLGAAPSVGRRLVPEVLNTLLAEHGGLTVHLEILSVAQVLDYVLNGPGECAVSIFPIAHGAVRSSRVGNARLVCLVPCDMSDRFGATVEPIALAGQTLIAFEPHTVHGQVMARFLDPASAIPRRTHLVRFAESAVGLAEAGLGIALVDEFSALSADRARVAVRQVAFPPAFDIFLHVNHERPVSHFTELFERALSRRLARIAAAEPCTVVGGAGR
ncbi:LysR family transcriptional regulator [Phreatobacter sp. AB_2022a]|uniref:LysR family transcriptional regulator n=1 Tax=Phreatobacter sp. AB_2022a TaxID=3003134 RepID=UPI0022872B6D|nr:LysR family transcriptional regulator [Phreatobacter sp. AB_2022a]MCZ0733058.1 LysR family transcriptional regulator [Phreatobacter sp. AB_2022a]